MSRQPRWKYVMYVLMVVYVAFISVTLLMIDHLMQTNETSTRRALSATINLRIACNDLQKSLPDILSSALPVEATRQTLNLDWQKLRSAYLELRDCFYEDVPDLVLRLDKDIENLRQDMDAAADRLEGNQSYEVVEEYLHNAFTPLFGHIQIILSQVAQYLSSSMEQLHSTLHLRIKLIIAASIIAGAVIVLFTMLYDRQVEVAGKEIAYRQELFRQLANSVDEVFMVAVNANRYEYVPGSTRNILNLPEDEIYKDPSVIYKLLAPEDEKWIRNILDSDELDGAVDKDVYVPALNKYLKFRVYSILIPSIRQKRFIVVISDQTEIVLHHQALSDALESADAASAAKSGFLSHMSHEIRTPMNAIIGMTTIALSRLNDSERVKACLGKISDSSRHLLGLINDVLDMSKIESGKMAINSTNFNLHDIVDNINNIVRPQTESRKLRFDILLEDVDEENLVGDAMRINQVLLNILSNACKFTPEGGRIIMKLKQLEKKNGTSRIQFIISDTGIGMSEEFLTRLYQPFEQATSSTASKYGGTGLGMPITANLVAMMGGTINVKSQIGGGTTFYIELPFGISGNVGSTPQSLPPARILIVDDDQGTCEHASHLLEKMGLSPEWTLTGEEAISMAREAHDRGAGYEICLIDWSMPGMNGGQTVRAIREVVGDDVLIIIISAYDWVAIEDEARASGVDDFIAKPFFASNLYDAVVSATHRLDAETIGEPAAAVKKGYDFSGKRALLVEDNEFNREIGEEFLQMVNMEVDHAENGKEAVDKFADSPEGYYDIVLMDVQMPIMDGYEATHAIRASSHPEAQTMTILAMTANAFSEDVAKAVAAGMNGHIAKPIDVNELYRIIARYLMPDEDETIV